MVNDSDGSSEHYLDMVGVRGSIPLAPTISRCWNCNVVSTDREHIVNCCFICGVAIDCANSRERTQNTAHRLAQNPPTEFS